MAVPYTFGTATAAIPLSQLDSNFATAITIGNTAVQLGNTVTTLNNMTLANVTISSGTVTITNVAVTTANVSGTANISTLVVVGNETVGGNTTITGNITAANANVTTNLVLSGGTANGVGYLNGSKVLTTGSVLTFDGTNLALGGVAVSLGANWSSFTTNGTTGSGFVLRKAATDSAYIYVDNGGLQYDALQTKPHIWYINSAEKMRIASATGGVGAVGIGYTSLTSVGDNGLAVLGNVGIGTSSPSYKLDVTNNSTNILGRFSSSYAYGTALQLVNSSTGGGTWTLYSFGQSNGEGAGNFGIANVAGNKFTLDSSGNLGLRVTPNASWDGTFPALQIGLGTVLYNNTSANGTFLGSNFYWNGANNIYLNNANATAYGQTAGAHQWFTAGIGTGIVNFTQAMTLDASGNLLVGTTSQIASARSVITGASGNAQVIYFNNTRNNGTGDATAISLLGSSDNNTSNYHYIGTTGGTDRVYIFGNGNIQNTNNSYGAISDSKLKENIVDASPKLADMMQVRVRNYNLIGETQKQIGVVAQELETVFPGMIDETPDRDAEGNDLGTTTKSVKYSVFVPMLIKAIQELKAEFDAYKASHP